MPDHEGGKSQDGQELRIGKKEEIKAEHEKVRVDSTVKKSKFQGGEGGQARKASLGEVEGSMSG